MGNISGSRTGHSTIWDQFIVTGIKNSIKYDRAAGFYDSSVFSIDLSVWIEFIERGGKFRLVCSPILSIADISAAYKGLYQPSAIKVVTIAALRTWLGTKKNDPIIGCKLFSWLLATGRMEMFIAIPTEIKYGIYHEKFGLFTSEDGKIIGFSGSPNETASGYSRNFERIEIFSNYDRGGDQFQIQTFKTQFNDLVEDRTPKLRIVTMQRAFQDKVLEVRKPRSSNQQGFALPDSIPTPPPEIVSKPAWLELRSHQQQAVNEWLENQGRGIFAMATGAGKTLAALCAVEAVYDRTGPSLAVIVVVPYLVLAEQWEKVMKQFGMAPTICAYSRASWESQVRASIYLINSKSIPVLSLIVTNKTFSSKHFQDVIAQLKIRSIIIADEVHNLGARTLASSLPGKISLRLGLSATPQRFMDEDGSAVISDYFGKTLAPFGIAEALQALPPVLCPYDYIPIIVELTDDETYKYIEVTKKLARLVRDPSNEDLSQGALILLLERARILASAYNKLSALKKYIEPFKYSNHNLIYCGDGSVEYSTYENEESQADDDTLISQVDATLNVLNRELGMTARRYTYRENAQTRKSLLEDFQAGSVQAIVAVRCLDEGVDIPEIKRAFILASSTNPRQFIQRRGRVLRPSPGKTHAEIYDFIVKLNLENFNSTSPEFTLARNLLFKEMARVIEFCNTARNKHSARSKLQPILSRYGLEYL